LMAAPFGVGLAVWGDAGLYHSGAPLAAEATPAMLSIVILMIPASFGIEQAAALKHRFHGADGD